LNTTLAIKKPLITVYILCHNYGRYLSQAVDSVLAQSFVDWELIIVNDGSQDGTGVVMEHYLSLYPEKMRSITHPDALGLQISANQALELARGKYIIRLDADDYLDESALLVLSSYLDEHPNVALVYPNFIYIDEFGNFLGVESRKKIGIETQMLDLPAHGACTMIRKRVLKSIGGYNENFDRQDGYELWLKVINRYPVANITTPLFFYRQHGESLTQDEEALLGVRARIKREQVELRRNGPIKLRSLAVVLAKNTYKNMPNIVLSEVAGTPLISYTLDAAIEAGMDSILVTTDDQAVIDFCETHYPEVYAILRSPELQGDRVWESALVTHALSYMEAQQFYPDVIASLSIHTPLRRSVHIQKALDTLVLYDIDSVIGVYEDRNLHFTHGKYGLKPLNPAMHRRIRIEREGLFVENGAVRVFWRDTLTETDMFGKKVGHIVMSRRESYNIKHPQDVWLIEQIVQQKRELRQLVPSVWLKKENQ
jgi:CMP-N-acetylneuraminic acid synthetase